MKKKKLFKIKGQSFRNSFSFSVSSIITETVPSVIGEGVSSSEGVSICQSICQIEGYTIVPFEKGTK